MNSVAYIANDRYAFEVAALTAILRSIHDERIAAYPRQTDPAEVYERVHVALRAARFVDLGEPRVINCRVEPEHHGDLVEALATLEPDAVTGTIEGDQVKLTLAEVGAIFPASARPTVQEAARAALEDAKAITRPFLETVAALGTRGFDKMARQHIEAFRAEADRQADAAFAAAPDHLKNI